MKMEYVLSEQDLLDVRFAISPLGELTLSLRALHDPGRYPWHLPFVRRVLADVAPADLAMLRALTNQRAWTPDYLTPVPTSPLTRFTDQLDEIRRTPPAEVARNLEGVHGERLPAELTGDPASVGERIADTLGRYWDVAFAPVWDRMRTVLEADVVHRGRVMTDQGPAQMFSGLSERITFVSPVVQIAVPRPEPRRVETGGRGLTLCPSLFVARTAVPIYDDATPQIMYAARGVGTLWQSAAAAPAPAVLAAILGEVRARLLTELVEPASSTELALRSGVTPSAVNQHLRVLHAAGLLSSARHGRSMLYRRSELGDRLVEPSSA